MKRIALLFFGVLVLSVGGIYYWRHWEYTHSPFYSLLQVQKAIREHDVGSFQKYVDIDEVVERAITQLMEAGAAEPKGESSAHTESDGSLANGILALMKPGLTEIVKDQVLRYVETGRREQPAQPENTKAGTNEPLPDAQPSPAVVKGIYQYVEEIQFQGMGAIAREGKIAHVGFKFLDERYNLPFTIDVKMWDMGDYWRVAEVGNLADVLQELDHAEKQRVEKLNAGLRAAIAKSLQVVGVRQRTNEGLVLIEIDVRNIAPLVVKSFKATVGLVDLSGHIRAQTSKTWEATISAGGDTWVLFVVNPILRMERNTQDEQFQDTLFTLEERRDLLRIATEITSITFADGTGLSLVRD